MSADQLRADGVVPIHDGTPAVPERVVVASVPAGHAYVHHCAPETGPAPRRLPDPPPFGSPRSDSQRWWPPAMLDPSWVQSHEFNLFHLHFGFDAYDPQELEAFISALRRKGRPLVYTVHDLRNPHHPTRELHDRQLDVLVPAATQLITLTSGAADEIRRRWDREAIVLPHPHVVGLASMRALRRHRAVATDQFRIGVHLKSLRPSMDPMAVLPTLVEVVADLPGAVLRVNAHRDMLDDGGARHDAELAAYLTGQHLAGRLELHVHDYFTDDQLWRYLSSLDVSVLPYRFGTHSGWLEACRDLGTTVIAPTCGYFADQGPVLDYVLDEARFGADSLARAVTCAYQTRPELGADLENRRRQRRDVAAAHDLVYGSVLGQR